MEPHEKWLERERKSKSEGVSRREHPTPQRRAGLTGQHESPHQHHVPWVLAHVCWRLQWLQHGRGGCLFEQKPQGRQLPRGHDGEVDPSLQERGQAVRTGPQGPSPRRLHTPARWLDGMDPKTKFPSGYGTGDHETYISCPGGFCDPKVQPHPPPPHPGVLTSPIFCTRLSVVHPEYVVLSTAGSRYGGELQMRRQTRCVWPLPRTRTDVEQVAARP